MPPKTAINIDDLRQFARRRLPRIVYDYLEGGVDDERGLSRNRGSFEKLALLPRRFADLSDVDSSTEILGSRYASPFGIAPMGSAGLFRPGADLMFAEAAKKANVPFVLSSVSTSSLEEASRVASGRLWLQMYAAKRQDIYEGFLDRASKAGINTIVLTVDVPKHAKRERDIRNGFSLPRRLRLSTIADALAHPRWLFNYLKSGGMPMFENWRPYAPGARGAGDVAKFVTSQIPSPLRWPDLLRIRQLWPHNLVIKGLMRPDDARRARDLGASGVIVSNHGGRQLDSAASTIEALPEVVDAVGRELTVMLDSGIRRGSDVIIALSLGAKFVFVGRPAMYGAAWAGTPGVVQAMDLLHDEVMNVMTQVGCPNIASISGDLLWSDN